MYQVSTLLSKSGGFLSKWKEVSQLSIVTADIPPWTGRKLTSKNKGSSNSSFNWIQKFQNLELGGLQGRIFSREYKEDFSFKGNAVYLFVKTWIPILSRKGLAVLNGYCCILCWIWTGIWTGSVLKGNFLLSNTPACSVGLFESSWEPACQDFEPSKEDSFWQRRPPAPPLPETPPFAVFTPLAPWCSPWFQQWPMLWTAMSIEQHRLRLLALSHHWIWLPFFMVEFLNWSTWNKSMYRNNMEF